MKKSFFFFSLLLLFLPLFLTSCEWDGSNDDNYTEVNKPVETINWGIDLAGINPEEVIQIANGSRLTYTIYSGGHDLLEQKYYLDGVELTNWSSNSSGGYYVHFDGYTEDGTIHKLKLVMALRTNTGSLADMARAEFYTGEYDFKLKFFDRNQNVDLKIVQSLAESKYLKLEWNKPKNIDVEKYEVYTGGVWNPALVATITNPDETYFVDKNYHYGWEIYTVKAIAKNSINIPIITQDYTIAYNIFNEDRITTSLSANKLKINWTNANPYPLKYVVRISDNIYPVEIGKTNIEIPRPYFPFTALYTLNRIYLLPLDANVNEYDKYPYSDFYFSDKQTYQYPYWTQFFDSKSNSIIALRDRNFYKYEVQKDLKLTTSGTFPNNISYPEPFVSDSYSYAKSGIIAIRGNRLGNEAIYVFKDCNFTQILNTFAILPDRFCISDSHLFYTSNKKLYALNISTGQVDDEKAFASLYGNDTQLIISSSGKYLIHYSSTLNHSWYTIYEFKNNKLQEIKHGDVQVRVICFNPANESQVFLHDYDDRFKIMDVVSQQILKTVDKNRYLYSDPYTENVLCYEVKTGLLNVFDKTLSNILFTVKGSIQFPHVNHVMLVNNILYCNQTGTGHYYVNISESLRK